MGVLALGDFPEFGLLQRGEEIGGVGVVEGPLLPEVVEPGAPVVDGWRGPCRVAEGPLGAGVVQMKAACGAGVAGEDGGAAGECLKDGFRGGHEKYEAQV